MDAKDSAASNLLRANHFTTVDTDPAFPSLPTKREPLAWLACSGRSVFTHREARPCHVCALLDGAAPIVAATDYVRAYPQLIAAYLRARFVALGTDGFGRSDTRSALRSFFEVDRHHVAIAALDALVREGALPSDVVAKPSSAMA